MNPSMDDRRILAEMERHLSRDDPELVSLMDALNGQFPDDQEYTDRCNDGGGGHDWRWKACVVFALVVVVSLILTLAFSGSPSAEDDHGPPHGRVPGVSVHSRRQSSRSRDDPEPMPTRPGRRVTDLPGRWKPHACTRSCTVVCLDQHPSLSWPSG
ncbi:DUF3040 domain-containing protein [Streptomyces sp. ISL-10]|uniref:DUF3040 domain-containing protein n=1 Tax=Streptomyces sp. ISL-10 TaxID=2819172 RepID=UPI001BEBA364|nr:DUF3040 domain-containing protein [Streptomyces sp. ISL-10]MBT2367276.1 DUF3040 domain-containing protein [Streptomyces sp. ISL-10]